MGLQMPRKNPRAAAYARLRYDVDTEAIMFIAENIPQEMARLPQWVVWGVPNKVLKCPFNPATMIEAKAGRPETWGSFEQAVDRVRRGQAQGVGFEFLVGGGIVGIDLDTVRDPESGKVAYYALEMIKKLDSFTEVSMSGYGVHIFCFGEIVLERNKEKLPPNSIKRPVIDAKTGKQKLDPKTGELLFKEPEIELYNKNQFFAMTGNLFVEAGCL